MVHSTPPDINMTATTSYSNCFVSSPAQKATLLSRYKLSPNNTEPNSNTNAPNNSLPSETPQKSSKPETPEKRVSPVVADASYTSKHVLASEWQSPGNNSPINIPRDSQFPVANSKQQPLAVGTGDINVDNLWGNIDGLGLYNNKEPVTQEEGKPEKSTDRQRQASLDTLVDNINFQSAYNDRLLFEEYGSGGSKLKPRMEQIETLTFPILDNHYPVTPVFGQQPECPDYTRYVRDEGSNLPYGYTSLPIEQSASCLQPNPQVALKGCYAASKEMNDVFQGANDNPLYIHSNSSFGLPQQGQRVCYNFERRPGSGSFIAEGQNKFFTPTYLRRPVRSDILPVRSPEYERNSLQGYMQIHNPNFAPYYPPYEVPCYHGLHYLENSGSHPYSESYVKIPAHLLPGKYISKRPYDFEANRFSGVPLEDLVGHIYALCKDQHGCRYLQKKLEENNERNIDIIFTEVFPHFVELMTDPFGNYLCQKLLEFCKEEKQTEIVDKMAPELVNISFNMHGTRAVQKAVELLSNSKQIGSVIDALKSSVVILIKDLNGNHVVQKCLSRLSSTDNQFIYDAVTEQCVEVATHRHGCCVLQRCIDHASEAQRNQLIGEITANALTLVQDPFGNYVVQYVLELGEVVHVSNMIRQFLGSICTLSIQKFSSNVIEKCIRVAERNCKRLIITELTCQEALEKLLRDSYANYVVQTALDYADPIQHTKLVECIRPLLPKIRNSPCGKRLYSKLYRCKPSTQPAFTSHPTFIHRSAVSSPGSGPSDTPTGTSGYEMKDLTMGMEGLNLVYPTFL